MASVAECPPCGPDAVLCCRAAVISMSQEAWQQGLPAAPTTSNTAQVFSTRAPRDAIAGASSGLKTFARSLAAGSAALICTPFEAARDGGGVTGTIRGVCEGVATAAILPCAGAAVAVGQFARGVAVTPQALVEAVRGQQWSDSDRCWQINAYSLAEEAKGLENRSRRDSKNAGKSRRGGRGRSHTAEATEGEEGKGGGVRVHGREYYRLLRVNGDASDVEIRRAYYRESRRYHPDKAGTDPQMVERFQQLSTAYQVLRSSELREAYDAGGQDAVSRLAATIDLGALYAAVMSGPQWEPYIGRLALGRILSGQEDQSGPDVLDSLASVWFAPSDSPSSWQAQREVQCAQVLAGRLQPIMDGEDGAREEFVAALRQEVDDLAKAPFAPALMLAIADVYANEATRFLGAFNLRLLTLGRELMQTHSQGRLLVLQAQAVTAGTRALMALRTLISEEPGPAAASSTSSSDEPRATTLCLERPAVQEQLPLLAIALWRMTQLDIEATLRRVCRRVLSDVSIDVEARQRRAEGLLLMASTLREAADARGQTDGPGENPPLLLDKVSEVATQMAGAGARGKSGSESVGADM